VKWECIEKSRYEDTWVVRDVVDLVNLVLSAILIIKSVKIPTTNTSGFSFSCSHKV
jgi:hypothetical protein